MSSQGPTCYVNPPTPPATGQSPLLPAIPIANDLASAIAAINAMRIAFLNMFAHMPPNNSTVGLQRTGGSSSPPKPPQQPKKGNPNFVEVKRTTTQTKVTNPDDPTQFVVVEQITALTFTDQQTGQTWVWNQ